MGIIGLIGAVLMIAGVFLTWAEMNISILINIHHVELALEYADRIIGIRAGKIVYDGPSSAVTQEVLDEIYKGGQEEAAPVPENGEKEA